MEKVISFVIMNVATSAVLGIFCLIFLYFVISNITDYYYAYNGFWRKYGMLVMWLLFVSSVLFGIQITPMLSLSIEGSIVVCILSFVYLLISCKATDNEIWELL